MTTRRATASEATDEDTGAIELDSTDGLVRADAPMPRVSARNRTVHGMR